MRVLVLIIAGFIVAASASAATPIVNETFANGSSRDQDIPHNSLNIFDGRTGATNTSGGTSYARIDAVGSLTYTMNTSTSSQAAWMFFTGSQATTSGTPPVSSGAWSADTPIVLQPGDTLTCIETFTVGNLQPGQDFMIGLWDSNGTRNTADLTGGQNDATFADDLGYGVDFFLGGSSPPFMIGKRDLSIATANGSLNNPFVNIASFPPLPGTASAVMPAMQTLANAVPYTLTLSVFRRDSSTNLITITVAGGSISGTYSWQVIDSAATQSTFDEFTGARFNGASLAGSIAFTNFQVIYTPAPPVILTQPTFSTGATAQTVGIGGQVTLSLTASGSGLTYQWFKGGAAISGATTQSVTLTNLQLGDAGSYSAVVTNGGGSVTSSALSLTVLNQVVNAPPVLTSQPASLTAKYGSGVSFSVAATGTALTYQWYYNGAALAGATQASYSLPSVQPGNAGTYSVNVSNDGGTVPSSKATLTVVSNTLIANSLFPANGSLSVCPDTHVTLTFASPPSLGASGLIRIFDASTNVAVDTIDLTSPRTNGLPVQTKSIGTLANFNYYPVIITGDQVAIYFRNNVLAYNKSYTITVDSGVFVDAEGVFPGFTTATAWTFTTRASAPNTAAALFTVAADGTGDFCTVQGAIDSIPAGNTTPRTIFIRRGTYTEIVYFAGKHALTFLGEDRFGTVITYPNNNNFNGTSASHRMVFDADGTNNTVIANLSLINSTPVGGSQAEALILNGGGTAHAIVTGVELVSYQDTLQANGQCYVGDSHISGSTDYMWGSGPNFFSNCELTASASGGYYTQIRNPVTTTGHGNVYLNCTLDAASGVTGMYLGRIDPTVYPFSEVVYLNCVMGNHILPAGWLLNNATTAAAIHFWEYNSHAANGSPVDVSQRLASSAQLTQAGNAATIANYSTPSYVLGGNWTPQLAPIIASQPAAASVAMGGAISLGTSAVGVPSVSYQWMQNGVPLPGATNSTYTVSSAVGASAGTYSVSVSNSAGTVTSSAAAVVVAGGPPVITLAPQSQAALLGATASFSAFALGGGPFAYQWNRNGAAISGATNRSLLLSNLKSADAGSYSVTIGNAAGATTSSSATLTLVAPAAPVPTLPAIPSRVFDATAYGAVGDGLTDNTASIQSAINAAKAAGGGTIELPPAAGNYLCGPITLYSSMNFQVDAGATLQALPFGVYPKSLTSPANFITLSSGSTNVELSGSGIIDGNGAPWWPAYSNGTISNRPRLVQISNVTNLLITGLTLENSPMFHLAFDSTSNVTIFGVTINTSASSPNTDGMDLAGSNYLVQNCSVSDGDDNIVAKPGSVLNSNLVIANCTFGSGHGVSIGGQTNAGLNGMTVMNCSFNGTSTGLRFKADATEGGPVQNVTFTDITMANVPYPILFYSYYNVIGTAGATSGSGQVTPATVNAYNAAPPDSLKSTTIPTWQNITINNLTATRASGYSTIWGLPLASALISNVTLNNVTISGGAGLEIYDATGVQITGNSNVGGTVTCNALAITGQPQSQAVSAGGSATFAVAVAGTSGATGAAPSYQWRFNGSPLANGTQSDGSVVAGATTPTLAISNVRSAETGSYACVVSNSLDGYSTTTGTLVSNSLPVSATSSAAALTVYSAPLLPSFTSGPASQSVLPGGTVAFNVAASGFPAPTFQWQLNGTPIPGATAARWVTQASAATAGAYVCVVTNSAGAASSAAATLSISSTSNPGRLINLSANVLDGSGGQFLTVGFVSGGAGTAGPETLLLRATGPALQAFGVNDVLIDPTLTVYGGSTVTASNSGWGTPASNQSAVTAADSAVFAFPLTNPASTDSALVAALPPNAYTALAGSASGSAGNVLVEIYDDTPAYTPSTPRLINLSCRQEVQAGSVLTAGFIIGGNSSKTVLIRATGPALTALGVSGAMPDPTLTVFSGQTALTSNAGWGGDPQITAADNSVFAFALTNPSSKDSAALLTLAPGAYTVQVTSASAAAGIALVEIYEVP